MIMPCKIPAREPKRALRPSGAIAFRNARGEKFEEEGDEDDDDDDEGRRGIGRRGRKKYPAMEMLTRLNAAIVRNVQANPNALRSLPKIIGKIVPPRPLPE